MEMQKSLETPTRPRLFGREIPMANVVLAIQFLLGMYLNLYVKFPTSGAADAWKFAFHSVPVTAHIILGTLALLAGINTLVRSILLKNRHWILFAGFAVAAMMLSVLGGETFISTQNELASYFMAVGFLTGLLALNWGFYTQ
jgi:quinol-cytochrome oxidoreductase complex cytochrome b subunit